MAFNKYEYDQKYAKEHLSQICLKLPNELKQKFYNKLKKDNIGPTDFFKKAINEYLNEKK